jgi:hypothetical protein
VRPRREVIVLLIYSGLTLLATYPLLFTASTSVPAGGDSWLYYWDLWWVKRSLIDRPQNPFFTPDLYFPYGARLYFHTLNLLPSALALPVIEVAGLAPAFNLIVFAGFVLTAYATYRLALFVLGSDSESGALPRQCAAFVAGVVFTFNSYRYAHLLGHLDLLQTQWLPLFTLLLLQVRRDRSRSKIVACGLCLACTAFTSWHYVFLLLTLVVLIVVRAVASDPEPGPFVRRITWVLATFGVAVSAVLAPMIVLGSTEGRTLDPMSDAIRFSPDLLAYLLPSYLHPIWGRSVEVIYRLLGRESGGIERIAFLGFVPGALALTAIAAGGNSSLRRWSMIFIVYAALALGPVLHIAGHEVPLISRLMPYRLLMHLPYGDIPRVPSRFVSMASLALSMLAGIGARRVLRGSRARVLSLTSLICTLAIGENVVFPIPTQAAVAPPFFAHLASDTARGGVLEVPIPDDPATFPQRMLWQTVHGQPVFGGYLSRGLPPIPFEAVPGFAQLKTGTWQIDDVVAYDRDELTHIGRALLAEYGAKQVIIEKMLLLREDGQRFRNVADAILGESAMAYDDRVVTAYHVAPPASAPPLALWLDTGWSYLERSSSRDESGRSSRWRWMNDHARVGVISPQRAAIRLRLLTQSFKQPRRLQLSVDGRTVAVLNVATTIGTQETPAFDIRQGSTYIDLTSLERSEFSRADRRALSIAAFEIKVAEARP